MSDGVLEVKELTTKMRKGGKICSVVDRVSFSLKKGKTLALVGESGCGKSMAALSILRITPTPPVIGSEGEVLYNGKNLLEFSESEMRKIRGAKISMIFQDPMSALNPVYTVGDQLMEAASLHLNLYGEEAFDRCVLALKDVGIPSAEERMSDYPHQLSGGMKQRVMIAAALLCEPDVLIADEPTTALDVTIQAQILDLIRELQQRLNMAVLLITHDMGVVAEMADEVVVMYAAQIVESGSVFDVFEKRAHPYTEGLFDSRPSFEAKQKRLHVIEGSVPPINQLPSGCHFHPRCPYKMDICVQGEVPNFSVESEHVAKCWLHEKEIAGSSRTS